MARVATVSVGPSHASDDAAAVRRMKGRDLLDSPPSVRNPRAPACDRDIATVEVFLTLCSAIALRLC